MALRRTLPAVLILASVLTGCLGPSFEEFQTQHAPHLDRIDVRWDGEETSLRPGDDGFSTISAELLRSTYEIENVERRTVPPNQTLQLRNGSDRVEAVFEETRRIDPPDHDMERETDSILVVLSNTSQESLAGKLLLCLEDHCNPFGTPTDLPALRSAAGDAT